MAIEFIDDFAVVLHGAKTFVTFSKPQIQATYTGGGADARDVKELQPLENINASPWSTWGDDDNWPNTVKDDISSSIMLSRGLESRMKTFYGKGVMPFKIVIDDAGTEKPVRVVDPQISEFFRHTKIEHYISCAIRDHEKYANYFPRFILSKDRSKINRIVAEKARYCRWERIKDGRISNAYISARFGMGTTTADQVNRVPVINMFDDAEDIRNASAKEYIYRAMYPLNDNDYYAEPAWNSARKSGWVEIEKKIPQFKKYQFQNQMAIKYHIEIPYDYFERRYKDEWKKLDLVQKKEAESAFYQQVEDYLTDVENAGKTFITKFGYDPVSKKEIPGIKITVLADNDKDGEYLGDIDQANTQISYAIGWDRALIGQSGKSLGSGSGSDKREAFLIATSLLRLDRDFIFQPLNFIRDYNGWDPEIQFGFPDQVLTTLDTNPTGSQKVIN